MDTARELPSPNKKQQIFLNEKNPNKPTKEPVDFVLSSSYLMLNGKT